MSRELLELCLQISGSFENGDPAYDAITGNYDGCVLSVGILQFNAGSGSLAILIQKIIEFSSAATVNAFFSGGQDVSALAYMPPDQAKLFCSQNFLSNGMDVSPTALQEWQGLLCSEPAIQAQLDLAVNGVLAKAITLANTYTQTASVRDVAFFFDVVTQSGGMGNSRGSVAPLTDPSQNSHQLAIQMAQQHSMRTAQYWAQICGSDEQARLLLHYAYQRALLSRKDYVWDALSRRGSIACRGGVVHGGWFDFSGLLP